MNPLQYIKYWLEIETWLIIFFFFSENINIQNIKENWILVVETV